MNENTIGNATSILTDILGSSGVNLYIKLAILLIGGVFLGVIWFKIRKQKAEQVQRETTQAQTQEGNTVGNTTVNTGQQASNSAENIDNIR